MREEGRIKVKPPMEVADEGCGEWENTLVGSFLGQNPPIRQSILLPTKLGVRKV